MFSSLILIIASIFTHTSFSEANNWGKMYHDSANANSVEMMVGLVFNDGTITTFGHRTGTDGYSFLSTITPNGTIGWTKEISPKKEIEHELMMGSRQSTVEEPAGEKIFIVGNLAQTEEKNVNGTVSRERHNDLVVARFESNGDLEYSKMFGPPQGTKFTGDSVFFGKMADGNYISVHQLQKKGPKSHVDVIYSTLILKMNVQGGILWKHHIEYGENIDLQTVIEKNGKYYFFGHTRTASNFSVVVVEFRPDGRYEHSHMYSSQYYKGGIFLLHHKGSKVAHSVQDGFLLILSCVNNDISRTVIAKVSDFGKLVWTKRLMQADKELMHYSFLKKNDDDLTNPIVFSYTADKKVEPQVVILSEMDENGNIVQSRRFSSHDHYFSGFIGQKRKSEPGFLVITATLAKEVGHPWETQIYHFNFVAGQCGIEAIYNISTVVDNEVFDNTTYGHLEINPKQDFDVKLEGENVLQVKDRNLNVDIEDFCYFCNGKYKMDKSGCSNGGKCIKTDVCQCDEKKYGEKCEISTCYGFLSNNTKKVCSGHGNCDDTDHCHCKYYRPGRRCQLNICYEVVSSSKKACNGHGKCVGHNKCTCTPSWSKYKDCGTQRTWNVNRKLNSGNVPVDTSDKDSTIKILTILLIVTGLWACGTTFCVVVIFGNKGYKAYSKGEIGMTLIPNEDYDDDIDGVQDAIDRLDEEFSDYDSETGFQKVSSGSSTEGTDGGYDSSD